MAEELRKTIECDKYGRDIAVHSPTVMEITDKVNELIFEIAELRGKLSELEERIDELEWKYKA